MDRALTANGFLERLLRHALEDAKHPGKWNVVPHGVLVPHGPPEAESWERAVAACYNGPTGAVRLWQLDTPSDAKVREYIVVITQNCFDRAFPTFRVKASLAGPQPGMHTWITCFRRDPDISPVDDIDLYPQEITARKGQWVAPPADGCLQGLARSVCAYSRNVSLFNTSDSITLAKGSLPLSPDTPTLHHALQWLAWHIMFQGLDFVVLVEPTWACVMHQSCFLYVIPAKDWNTVTTSWDDPDVDLHRVVRVSIAHSDEVGFSVKITQSLLHMARTSLQSEHCHIYQLHDNMSAFRSLDLGLDDDVLRLIVRLCM